MASRQPLPVAVCGKTRNIMDLVTAALAPEYATSHRILSLEDGKAQLPGILREKSAPSSPGSPIAVVIGGGYTPEEVESMRSACQGSRPVPWVKVAFRYTPTTVPPPEVYAPEVAQIVKVHLNKLVEEGGLDRDEVHIV